MFYMKDEKGNFILLNGELYYQCAGCGKWRKSIFWKWPTKTRTLTFSVRQSFANAVPGNGTKRSEHHEKIPFESP